MLRVFVVTALILIASACPAFCGRLAPGAMHCCPHDEHAPAAPRGESEHDDACQIAPCFCGGSTAAPRDHLRQTRIALAIEAAAPSRDLPAAAASSAARPSIWVPPPLPPDALASPPLLI